MIVEKLESPWYLARAAARHFVACSLEAVAIRGLFTVALSGGSTPRSLYEVLADPDEPFRELVPWSNTHFFWSDERHVPPDHPDSNYRMAHESMLSHVPVPKDNIHRIHSENPDPAAAAQAYEETIKEVTGPIVPQLDLILLGLGNDGHTASIFPGSEVLNETTRLVAAPWVEQLKTYRITMTLPLINSATSV
ncbi:MAG TPA: 6-phosphogluconolactonase, partial [Pyrinomonadaceae bacterium]|nr:6-phosphogluconolactonase [Pyrinomonadaceae bacterium]